MSDGEDELAEAPPQGWLFGFDAVLPQPDRNAWTTPPEWTSILGEYDLDPCSNPLSTVRAKRTFSLEAGQDGIALARYVGRKEKVFINPPYGPGLVIQWVRAYKHTRFTFLVRSDTSTGWFAELEPYIELVCAPRDERIQFVAPPGAEKSSPDSNHYLYFSKAEDASPEVRARCYCWRPDRELDPRAPVAERMAYCRMMIKHYSERLAAYEALKEIKTP